MACFFVYIPDSFQFEILIVCNRAVGDIFTYLTRLFLLLKHLHALFKMMSNYS